MDPKMQQGVGRVQDLCVSDEPWRVLMQYRAYIGFGTGAVKSCSPNVASWS